MFLRKLFGSDEKKTEKREPINSTPNAILH